MSMLSFNAETVHKDFPSLIRVAVNSGQSSGEYCAKESAFKTCLSTHVCGK